MPSHLYAFVCLLFLSSCVFSLVLAEDPACGKAFSTPKATFDLKALTLQAGSYFSADADTVDKFNFNFNVCAAAAVPVTNPSTLCSANDVSTAAVYQYRNNTADWPYGSCTVLGRTTNMTWSLIDGTNAAIGLTLKYGNGDICDATGKPRDYTINFMCVDEVAPASPIQLTWEPTTCSYTVAMWTEWACPQECYVTKNGLCDNHGLCNIDPVVGQSRCYCNAGRTGADCQLIIPTASSFNFTTLLIVLVILLLLSLIALSVVLYYKVQRLNSDDLAYGKMSDVGDDATIQA